jgi:simple sugar transport system substrate-binding protein
LAAVEQSGDIHMSRIRITRTSTLAAVAAVCLLLLAACSPTGGAQQQEGAAAAGAAGGVDTPEITIAMVTHQAPGDTFWDFIRQGATEAARKNNVNLNYSNDTDAGNQARLVQNAIDQGVDGLAVTLAYPDAVGPAVQSAVDAGIPVVAFNSGLDQWQDYGAMMYFGQDEHIAGTAGAERLNEEGAQHVLCVIQEQGHVALETRCAGVTDTFAGTTENLYVTGTDMPSVEASITSKLQVDPGIDTVLTLGAPFAMTALQSVENAGSDATVVTFDLNSELLRAIQDGRVPWAINQQPFVQGYLSVDSLWLNIHHGATIGGGQNVLTGPSFVDETNVDTFLEQAEEVEAEAEGGEATEEEGE